MVWFISYLAIGVFWFLLIIREDMWVESCVKIREEEGNIAFLFNYVLAFLFTVITWPFLLLGSINNIVK